jgi:hypothetical protein
MVWFDWTGEFDDTDFYIKQADSVFPKQLLSLQNSSILFGATFSILSDTLFHLYSGPFSTRFFSF